MKIHLLKNQKLSQGAFEWLQQKYVAVDNRDHDTYATFLSQDCVLQFGNMPLANGKEALLSGIDHFWSSIKGLNHNFINVLGTDEHLVLEALIDYTRADSNVVQVPCVTIIERNVLGLARNIKIFLDIAPVFA